MSIRRRFVTFSILFALGTGCGPRGPSSTAVAHAMDARLDTLDRGSVAVRDQSLLEPTAMSRFYRVRGNRPAWDRRKAEQIVEAIRGVKADGLDPADYHLAAIERFLKAEPAEAKPAADLDLLLTDAVAAIVDHARYGRVHPYALNPAWNMDPREGAPPLEQTVARIASAGSPRDAIEAQKPHHFIYRGLVRALAQLEAIDAKGGWPAVPSGRALRPGMSDPRIAAVRARLHASGEYPGSSESNLYDAELKRAVALFQARHRLDEDGILGKGTIDAMNVTAGQRASQIRVNLERARWVLGGLGSNFLLVNLPAFKAYLIRGGRNVWEARTQIGDEAKQTPSFTAKMRTVVFNPDWTVPNSIVAEEVLEPMQRGVNALAEKKLHVFNAKDEEVDPSSVDWDTADPDHFNYTLRQPPGKDNPLGRVKFLFPNKYAIYLHDTPSQHLFDTEKRTFSHGCIRIENALQLAEILLRDQGWGRSRIEQALATTETQDVNLAHPFPVVIVYWTVSVGASGEVRFAKDIYDLDRPLYAALNAPPRR